MRTEKQIMDEFEIVQCQMSPENISGDGELSRSRTRANLAILQTKWKKLEKEIGRPVSQDEVFERILKRVTNK